MLDIVGECGQCHNKPVKGSSSQASLYDTYRRSYHGQVNATGLRCAARCSDCHGAHDIQRSNDPGSPLYGENRLTACRNCHKDADAKFAQFAPHADMHDGTSFPVLHGVWLYFVIMMSAAFGFFGLHCDLLVRPLDHRAHQARPASQARANGAAIKRFNRVDRVNHAFVIVSFFGLALTGLPLLYSDKTWGASGWRICSAELRSAACCTDSSPSC